MTKPLPQGWKVLTRQRFSISCTLYRGVHYIKNRRTIPQPGNGPLAIFKTIANATQFVDSLGIRRTTVVSCKYTPSTHTYMWSVIGDYMDTLLLCATPAGTILADSVTCLE